MTFNSPLAQRSRIPPTLASPDSTLRFSLLCLSLTPSWSRGQERERPLETQLLHHSSRNWQAGDVPPYIPEMEGAETEQRTVTPGQLMLPPELITRWHSRQLGGMDSTRPGHQAGHGSPPEPEAAEPPEGRVSASTALSQTQSQGCGLSCHP